MPILTALDRYVASLTSAACSVPLASVDFRVAASSKANTSPGVGQQRRPASYNINAIRISAQVYLPCRKTASRSPTRTLLRNDCDFATEAPAEQLLAKIPGPEQLMDFVSQVSNVVVMISYA